MEAAYYIQDNSGLECTLCPHNCRIKDGKTGICSTRSRVNDKIITLNYSRVSALNIDPIEKKPLYHFYPGSDILSVGSYGCNLSCKFCQNHSISQVPVAGPGGMGTIISAGTIVEKALAAANNCGVAFTYNEPVVWFEYMREIAGLAKAEGLKTVMVSNGYINKEPLAELLEFIDAFNIDLKSFNPEFYRAQTGATLEPVLNTISDISKKGKHLEITYLLIPGLNDKRDEFADMIDWISGSCADNVVLHISKYFPNYKSDQPVTPDKLLLEMFELARQKIKFVYLGNTSLPEGRDTRCPECSEILISRKYYSAIISGISTEGKCRNCGSDLTSYLSYL